MRIACVGGGPAALYVAILMKRADPRHEVVVYERHRPEDTFGFGVVFSDATLSNLGDADAESYAEIRRAFAHWDDIDVHVGGEVVRSTGHGFCGLGRRALLEILARRASGLGVDVQVGREVSPAEVARLAARCDLVVAADGVNSAVRQAYAASFRPEIQLRPNRFVWLGTTFPFPAFTFHFKRNEHGLFRVHAYRYAEAQSTFIVECTAETFAKTGLEVTDEHGTVAYCEALFREELAGHRLVSNRSHWRQFPVVTNGSWRHENIVLLGDAVHTAHFSIGSGTKLAMEDAIALRDALVATADLGAALAAYEAARRPVVESLQRTALTSLTWFEETERLLGLPPRQFAFSLLTRSLRVTHENLRRRDPAFVAAVNEDVAAEAERQSGERRERAPAPPPMFTPLRLRDLVLDNRVVVSPMCQYSAVDGEVDDWHLVHLGSRAVGGAGLVLAEMTDVRPDGRITPGCAGLYAGRHVDAWRRITRFVHKHTRARIGVQLAHAGRKGSTDVPWVGGGDEPLGERGWPLLAPSAIPFREGAPTPRPMTRADMDAVREDFVRAAGLAAEAGFDMLELHCAHGYLLAEFLSPLANTRTDAYGGALANRLRYPLEVFAAVREAWPAERPIGVRISAHDWAAGGVTPGESVEIARAFRRAGADILDVSSGGTVAGQRPAYGRLYQTPFSERIRLEAGVPTITVGAISSWSDVNSIIAAGRADLCALARGHLYDPYFTRHAARAQGVRIAWPPPYRMADTFRPFEG